MLELATSSVLAMAKLKTMGSHQDSVHRLETKLDAILGRDPKLGPHARPSTSGSSRRKPAVPFMRTEAFDAVTALFDARLAHIMDEFAAALPDLGAFVRRQFLATYRSKHIVEGKLRRFCACVDGVDDGSIEKTPSGSLMTPVLSNVGAKDSKAAASTASGARASSDDRGGCEDGTAPSINDEDVVGERLKLFLRVLRGRHSLTCFDALTVLLTELGGPQGVDALLHLAPSVGKILVPVGGGTAVCWLPQHEDAEPDAPPRVAALGVQARPLVAACRALVVHGAGKG